VAELNLTPNEVNITVHAGDGRSYKVTVDALAWPDYQGGTWAAQVRRTFTSADIAVTLNVTENADGVTVSIPPEGTAGLVTTSSGIWSGVWDLQVTKAGIPTTLLSGDFTVKGDVTR
jgi:hypothetical protein